ncbi:cytochrome c biogenesis protein DipZ [Mycolicibacterium sphagni]|uniref:Thiol:disulfide interchange protein n=1 Tax=Mycolicibacterium sphagni TaxID=1786 RepID=A0A255DYM2_9MYCO|nr:cytochrome c biogenesis protein DipZ [Mycolicibacterium sphagni]MCV7179111.1 cytochrome c biogenesis protein DipZ [Mycolicibacterium sphagni]OYN82212.1 thiol:disulfide interchange protein [Mycolicibacterium sphagni]
MAALLLIGLLGGLITGISPCVLPVLPVVFLSAADTGDGRDIGSVKTAGVTTASARLHRFRPYLVIAGLVCSFSVVTLTGSALLSALHLPQDAIRWVGLAALALIGVGLIFPQLEALLEKPFAAIPQRNFASGRTGFGLGLALGALYVPCAGPVLAAIVLAGATGHIGAGVVLLTVAFSLGTALPLTVFALAGQRITQRVKAFRDRQRTIRVAAGIVTLALAVALAFDLPAELQRALPDYTSSLQDKIEGSDQLGEKLDLGGLINDQNRELSDCTNHAAQLQSCGTAPDIRGITEWLNTPGGAALNLADLRGKVVLVDFWAYSCINCQRALPHVIDWYAKYKDLGLQVIGIHSPEYAFEKVRSNVASGAAALGITYPIALDNNLSTWVNYRNRYWPADYLIDSAGTVRHITFGEGDYADTERLMRQLLTDAHPGEKLPAPGDFPDITPPQGLTPETYLSVGKVVNYGGEGQYRQGERNYQYPAQLRDNAFAYRGTWSLDYQGAIADADDCAIELNYRAKDVYLVAGGAGTVTVSDDGQTRVIPISGPPTSHQIVAANDVAARHLEIRVSRGVQAFSFTYG